MAEGTNFPVANVESATCGTGDGFVYGILRGCDRVMELTRRSGHNFYHVDHGYFRRGHYNGFYRITKNETQLIRREVGHYPPDRWRKLQITLEPWKKDGTCISVVPPTRTFANFVGLDMDAWLSVVKSEIATNTNRPVVVCTKADRNFSKVLQSTWAVVVYNSNAAVDALVAGVPVIAYGPSCARPLSWNFEDLERPWYPENREEWCKMLSYHQYTVDEMKDGTAWTLINEFS